MSKKLTAAALAALMVLGMTGCSSGTNVTRDPGRSFPAENYGSDGYGDSYDSSRRSWEDDENSRYRDMLENGRVHDSDGYLLDGENSRG